MDQDILNFVLSGGMALLGWLGKTIWDAVQEMKNDIKDIEVELPTYYVRKDELDARLDKVENMLGKIYDKLDQKVDK